MILNKYQKFMKNKNVAQTEGAKDTENKDFIKYFNPNKLIMGKPEVVVRVLPNKKGMFFIQYKKHSFKIGTWKNIMCGYSTTADGTSYTDSCPFCDFVEKNKNSLEKNSNYQLSAKDSYTMLIYNPWNDEIQKYEFNNYGLTDILTALYKLGEDFDPDVEGFNLHFQKGSSGYAEIYKVSEPDTALKDLFVKSQVKEIPDLDDVVFPKMNKFIENYIQTNFNLAINVFAPTFSNNENKSDDEDEINETNVKSDYDLNDDFELDKDSNLDEEDIEISELEKALAARKKNI